MRVRSVVLLAVFIAVPSVPALAFEISSPSLVDYKFDKKYLSKACGGLNVSPALDWKDPPTGTKGFALTLFDPDAKNGAGYWHWQVVRLSSKITKLREGASPARLPKGTVQLAGDSKKANYQGPCPPVGTGAHRYVFTLYALKSRYPAITADATPGVVADVLTQNAIGTATVTYKFGR